MDKTNRRAARAAAKEAKLDAGIFAFRGDAGGIWVGRSPTLASAESRLRFSLRQGGGFLPEALKDAWAAGAGEGFRFEVLERLDPETPALLVADTLKARAAFWRDQLGADAI